MAITIRNKETEAMIRKLGQRWSTGPSGVIKRLAELELRRTTRASDAEYLRRLEVWDELDHSFPKPTVKEKRDMRRELDRMYDYLEDDADNDAPARQKAAS